MKQVTVDIRTAGTDDLSAIVHNEVLAQTSPWSKPMLSESLSGEHLFWVAQAKLQKVEQIVLIGHMVVMCLPEQWELLNLVVAPDFQGRGIGTLWMRHLISEARKSQIKQIFLEVRESNLTAISLYHKFAFKSVGRRKNYYQTKAAREDALVMQADLN